jgi:hypothetical protein
MISIPACKRGRIALSPPPSSYLHATNEGNGFYAHREQVGGEAGRDTRSHPGLHVTPPYTGTLPIETSDALSPTSGFLPPRAADSDLHQLEHIAVDGGDIFGVSFTLDGGN